MTRLGSVLIALVLITSACSSDAGTASSSSNAPTTAPDTVATSTTASTAQPTTSTPASTQGQATSPASTTSSTTTATTQATTTSTTIVTVANELPTLADGRPATFVAVTDRYEAVEIDTATGEIIAILGQTGTVDDFTDEMEIAPNVIVGAWRSADGSAFALSDCCEPAAGRIMFVADGDILPEDYGAHVATQGWTISPAPTGDRFARLGYALGIFTALPTPADSTWIWIQGAPGQTGFSFPAGHAAWSRDASRIYWIGSDGDSTVLSSVEVAPGEPPVEVVGTLDFVEPGDWFDGIAMQASGNLVGFLHQIVDGVVSGTQGVVFDTAGELIATFPVETASTFGGYEPTGKYLIYVDDDGLVRWQGRGDAGVLGEGFIHASW